ncbi:MAG: MFS transporter [Ignavibacteriales bacterium]|nr:MFS transporter [Ignavibacteriales bacterium]
MSPENEKQQETKEKKTFSQVVKDSFKELGITFVAFAKAPRALWGINVPYILEGLVYFGILTILGTYGSENVGLLDTQSGLVYSFVTGGITLAMLLFGGLADKIGVRGSLRLAFLVFVLGRAVIALSGSLGLTGGLWSPMFFTMIAGLLFMVTAYGLYQPAAYAGVRRYTTPQTAAMGYAVIYGLMNLGAFLSGLISSNTRHAFEDTFPPNGLTAVFWVYVGISFIALLCTIFLLSKKNDEAAIKKVKEETDRINEESGKEKEKEEEVKPKEKVKILSTLIFFAITVIFFLFSGFGFKNTINQIFDLDLFGWKLKLDLFLVLAAIFLLTTFIDYVRKRPYHPFRDKRFTFFVFMLIPVQTLFAHNWLTIPYYLNRAFAGSVVSEYFEVFSNLNPILIFVLAPIVAGLTARANVYKMMIYGTFVMALPTFLLVIGPNLYLFLLYILLMTIGEAMWQPRFLQWIAEVAPKNMTGLYMGVGQFPWFLTKVITGFYSGWFLMKYCPLDTDPSQMNTEFMWLVYALIAMVTPIALVLAKNWMVKGFKTKHEG